MNRIFKTSWSYRYGYAFAVIISLFNIYIIDHSASKILWAFNAIAWTIMLFRYAQNQVYISIREGLLTINEGRKTNRFPIEEIEYIKMNYHPFGHSYFQLKDGRKISFNPRVLPEKEADSLKEICEDIRG